MSDENNDQAKVRWDEKSVSILGMAAFAGILGIVALATGALAVYVFLNPPEIPEVVEVAAPVPVVTVEAVVEDEYPSLAVLSPVSFPPDNPYSPEKAELGKLLFFDTVCLVMAACLAAPVIRPVMVVGA